MTTRTAPPDTCRLTISIRGELYGVRILDTDPEAGVNRLVRLRKADGSLYYVVDVDGQVSCDCADAEFRHTGNGTYCKHARALLAVGLI
jgi:hypothetical protein